MSADYRVESRACSRCGEVEPLDQGSYNGVCFLCIAEERLEQARRELSRAKAELESLEQETKGVA